MRENCLTPDLLAEENMEDAKNFSQKISVIGDGALLIWCGIAILIDSITIGMGAVGAGMIMLGANVAWALKGVPVKSSTTLFGAIAIVWGSFDHILELPFWTSFAALLIVIGLAVIVALAAHPLNRSPA